MGKNISVEVVATKILLVRGRKVMLDRDLAKLYGVKAIALRQQVRRNLDRFPEDFMFQLSGEEALVMVSQNVIPGKRQLGGALPYVFTQEGVAMLSSVLHSQRAAQVNIAIMRAFVKLRELLLSHKELAGKIEELERRVGEHDEKIVAIFEAIKQLLGPPPVPPKPQIGFR